MRVELPDASIVYDGAGEGEPVVFLHGSLCADWLTPMARELTEFRRVVIHPAGYGRSEDRTSGAGVPALAAHCAAVLAELGVPRAHWVGHSAAADIALHLAYARPDLAASLVLLEPALPQADDEPASAAMPTATAAAKAGAWEAAFYIFLTGVCGSGVRRLFTDRLGERGLAEAVASSRYFFTRESAAFARWQFGTPQMNAVPAPALLVVGGGGARLGTPHRARAASIATRLPHTETLVVDDLTHAMPLEDPVLMAHIVSEFVARHPLSDPAG
ncbi:alpha/beta hydrolase [Streptomyces samsunensis]|uniref:alpha/beta fold hydrolase n=1 Tax=Streptomyces malaysiensis TaxID=92644 RepID=UPI00158292AB|nr:alpha/beta hydrolase [Streptomyces samsunensis]NUH40122.1 alpha/beta hydrolase [Streptomyces samsunensis]